MGCSEDKHGGCGPSFELGTAEYEAALLIATPRGSVYTEMDSVIFAVACSPYLETGLH
jgi:hypothetical protein